MTGGIFISYRRDDDPGFAGRLFDRLSGTFDPSQLFMDVDSIKPGIDFVRTLEEQIDKCDVMLAVIGQGWVEARDEAGRIRLEQPDDFVRLEIESALKLGKRVIPVLTKHVPLPDANALPLTLRPLLRRNAVRLTHERFGNDVQGLIEVLRGAIHDAETARQAALEAEAAAERERLEQERARAEETARLAREQARQNALAALSAEQIAKAEELANWDFIKASEDAEEFRNHLSRFPNGITARMAGRRLEELVWQQLSRQPDLDGVAKYLAEFPDGVHAADARKLQAELEAEADARMHRKPPPLPPEILRPTAQGGMAPAPGLLWLTRATIEVLTVTLLIFAAVGCLEDARNILKPGAIAIAAGILLPVLAFLVRRHRRESRRLYVVGIFLLLLPAVIAFLIYMFNVNARDGRIPFAVMLFTAAACYILYIWIRTRRARRAARSTAR